jgi:hypothetical protein
MLQTTFGRLLRGDKSPRPGAGCQFRDALEGHAAPGLTVEDFGRRLRGEPKAKPGEAKKVKAVLEGAPLPSGWKKRRRKLPAGAPRWQSRSLTECERTKLTGPGLRKGRKHELLESVCQADGVEVGEEPIFRGVRVLGEDSLNKRKYTRDAMERALALYERAPVFVDHPDRPTSPRSLKDKFGQLLNCRLDDEGVVADLLFNPSHEMAATIRWWFENLPEGCGLSHNATGEGRTEADGTFVITRIVRVRSCDLVASPATVRGMR